MSDPFARLQSRLSARMGKRAFLRNEPTRAILTEGVITTGEYGEVTGYCTTAAVPASMNPRRADRLEVCVKEIGEDGASAEVWRKFTVDKTVSTDGYETKVIVLEDKTP